MNKRIFLMLTLLIAVVTGAKAGKYSDALKERGTITFNCRIYSETGSFEFTNNGGTLTLTNRDGGEKGYFKTVTVSAELSGNNITFNLDGTTLMDFIGKMEVVVNCEKDSITYNKKSEYLTLNSVVATVPAHTHAYSTEWTSDSVAHWHECTSAVGPCDAAKSDSAAHTFGQEGTERYTCTVCKYVDNDKKAVADSTDKAAAAAEQAVADSVVALIDAIGTVEYTKEVEAKITSAQQGYDGLTDAQKKLVPNDKKNDLTAAVETFAKKKVEAENQAAADSVVTLIDAIGTVEYTAAILEKIDTAQAAYDSLTDVQKELVPEQKVKDLEAAKKTYEQLKAEAEKAAKDAEDKALADSIIALIDAIGTVEYTETSKTLIDNARSGYDSLTTEQKALVTNLETLKAAEAAYAELVVDNTNHSITIKEGTQDADKWTITPSTGKSGDSITIKYSGSKKVKSVKAVKVESKTE